MVDEEAEFMENPAPANPIKGTILFVDDEKMVLDIGAKMLKRLGFNVIAVDSGREAIEIFKQENDCIDMVILDIVMPDLGGSEVVAVIKDIKPDTKIMLSSGYGKDDQTAEIIQRCHAFIQKPFSMKNLAATLQDMMP
jgi:CheY-like chemotaxis protein